MAATKHPSFSDFAKGMVISEADVVVTAAGFEYWDYAGKRKDSVPAFRLTLKTTGGDVYDQYYSIGSAEDFAPSKDGKTLDILSDREKIHEQSNFAHFMEAMFKAGFPRNRVDNADIGFVVGTEGHVKQETIKRSGTGVQSETSILVFDKITALPGEGGTKSDSGSASTNDSEAAKIASDLLMGALSETGSIERKKLLPTVIKMDAYSGLAKGTKTEVLNLVKSDEFILNSKDWTVSDTGIIELGG